MPSSRLDAAATRTLTQWPLLSALVVFGVGVVVSGLGHWRVGVLIAAAALALAGVLRWLLPSRLAGLLVVRARWFDVLALLGTAVAMGTLALVVPSR